MAFVLQFQANVTFGLPMSSQSFKLTKWYFDVLDSTGRGMIGYQADLSWGQVNLTYEGVIPIGPVGFKTSGGFNSQAAVIQSNGQLDWNSKVSTGTWRARSPAVTRQLFHAESGAVNWQCLQPASEAQVSVGAITLNGRGYAEKLEMTLPPWRLPIKELLWGRFVSDHHAVVWIRWNGPEPRIILYSDGALVPNADIDQHEVSFEDYTLTLPRQIIRKGTIGDSLFAGAGKLAALFPSSILAVNEEKWFGSATLKQGTHAVETGSVIHECVRWP